jgi:hypothetical protein
MFWFVGQEPIEIFLTASNHEVQKLILDPSWVYVALVLKYLKSLQLGMVFKGVKNLWI